MPEDQKLTLEVIKDDTEPVEPTPTRRSGLWRLYRIPMLFVLLFLGGIYGLYFQPPGLQRFFEATGLQPGGGSNAPFALPVGVPEDVVATLQPSDVVGLARLMPQGDIATVAPPFGAGDARISEILVSEGDRVEAGDTVAVLDNLSQPDWLRRRPTWLLPKPRWHRPVHPFRPVSTRLARPWNRLKPLPRSPG